MLRAVQSPALRRARPSDLEALTDLALDALDRIDTGTLLVSRERIRSLARTLISDASGLVLVLDQDGITGAIALSVSDGAFFERQSAGIHLWHARSAWRLKVLLDAAMRWVDARRAIKAVGVSFDFGCDARLGRLLERHGLKLRGPTFARY